MVDALVVLVRVLLPAALVLALGHLVEGAGDAGGGVSGIGSSEMRRVEGGCAVLAILKQLRNLTIAVESSS